MNIDFSKINALGATQTSGGYNDPLEAEKAAIGPQSAENGLNLLQLQADREKRERDAVLEICQEYQRNTAASGQLQAEILKGIRAGEGIYSLFLKAMKAISLMTHTPTVYDQAAADIAAIYGAGLLEREPLEAELEAIENRLERMTAALEREAEGDTRQRIAAAIKAHQQRAGQIRGVLGEP